MNSNSSASDVSVSEDEREGSEKTGRVGEAVVGTVPGQVGSAGEMEAEEKNKENKQNDDLKTTSASSPIATPTPTLSIAKVPLTARERVVNAVNLKLKSEDLKIWTGNTC